MGKNGSLFTGFLPAGSMARIKKIGNQIRSWRLGRRSRLNRHLLRWVGKKYKGLGYRKARRRLAEVAHERP